MDRSKTVEQSRVVLAQLMMPNDANHLGYVHGGNLMAIADKAAFACACRHAESVCVTACVDSVVFRYPIKIGQLVTFMASVNYAGDTSMEVGIRIISEDLVTREQKHTNSCYFTMVAVDDNGKPRPIPHLTLQTPEDKRRNAQAAVRRDFRLKQRSERKLTW